MQPEDDRRAKAVDPLDPLQSPPEGRFCDVVMDGGVVNGVVYPGFLIELARRFNFHSLGGTSVGAIAAALAAACEYNRRYGMTAGFNEGLAQMPQELAAWVDDKEQITKIRSLFQPHASVQPLFDWFVELLGQQTALQEKDKEKTQVSYVSRYSSRTYLWTAYRLWLRYMPVGNWRLLWVSGLIAVTSVLLQWLLGIPWLLAWAAQYFAYFFLLHPLLAVVQQVLALIRLPGVGACTGMRQPGSHLAGLTEWMHEGIQKSARLQLSRPLTFAQLWAAPAGPDAGQGGKEARSIDLRMITTCLSYGRVYELPLSLEEAPVLFRLSEFQAYFPKEVTAHLRRVSKIPSFQDLPMLRRRFRERREEFRWDAGISRAEYMKKRKALRKQARRLFADFTEVKGGPYAKSDLRLLPTADLPIVVAARLSMSCPILFQAMPLIGLNFDKHAEEISLVRLWFSDGGIGSNFPIHLFDQSLPRWPSFGLKIMEEPPRRTSSNKHLEAYIPFSHRAGAEDNLHFPRDIGPFTTGLGQFRVSEFWQFLISIYSSAKDGHDQSYLRMPDIRNRVVRVFLNGRTGNMLNLKIDSRQIVELAANEGAKAGRYAAQAYLGELQNPKYRDWVDLWRDHRWVRMNMLIKGLRSHLHGIGHAMRHDTFPRQKPSASLLAQIRDSVHTPPLGHVAAKESRLSLAQAHELTAILQRIAQLEEDLRRLDMPQPYTPEPMPELRFKPRF